MKYILVRTSCYDDLDPRIVKGIPNAKLEVLTYHWSGVKGDPLYHIKSVPARDEEREAYTIEIDSLEDLHKLIEDCGEPIIIFPPVKTYGFELPRLEIYDSYRE